MGLKWNLNNKKRMQEISKNWRERNPLRASEDSKKWRSKNPLTKEQKEAANIRSKKWLKKKRLEVLAKYGGRCTCCQEFRYEFLAIDHVNGGGTKEHQKLGGGSFYNKIIKEKFPSTYQILCHNCNQSYGSHGYCPHTTPSQLQAALSDKLA